MRLELGPTKKEAFIKQMERDVALLKDRGRQRNPILGEGFRQDASQEGHQLALRIS